MELFKCGAIRLKSGDLSNFKVECEAFSDRDWDCLARIIQERAPLFGAVVGVPRGGLPLQRALEPYATGRTSDPLLIVDDVYTRGTSIRKERDRQLEHWTGPIIGVVIFARNPITDDWVKGLWTLTLNHGEFLCQLGSSTL
jgi:hypothetical protein